ncbi:Hypothetical protein PHPALM_20403 [Phytophthora palmivora]|uniref:MULE transposase domain-containing protein n=1 Tax=Phytophthora palmivora TaxID=4796 RepID=A0A2P4XEY5_9STRA|nr:Hypothetical protein PHPALM_20403 [Phytophthora palmivora]
MEYTPRKRSSQHLDEMEAMITGANEVKNTVPAFAINTSFGSWEDFESHFALYKKMNMLKFRVRSSEKRSFYNKTHQDQILTEFEYIHNVFICMHGVSQKPRSQCHRNRKQRYCKCKARLTAMVNRISGNTYEILGRNQTLPLDEQDREDVKALADARVSSTHITNFLNERIVTPQQTRNLIRSITGQASGENRLTSMLHALRQLDESDVLVIQDQMDVTCGIVMQTKVQKMMFERWGETLTMDFTHGTNNLGYHLGSLVVTTATSRGCPVFDFMCLNDWEETKIVVIDKDFVKWQILNDCFPKLMSYFANFTPSRIGKMVMKRPVFRIKDADSDQRLNQMTTLFRTEDAYDAGYGELKHYQILLMENIYCWQHNNKEDRFMKLENNILRPEYLRLCLHLVGNSLQTVVGSIEDCETRVGKLCESAGKTTSCERSTDLSIWKVYSMNQSYTCHDVDWSCNCVFYTNSRYLVAI